MITLKDIEIKIDDYLFLPDKEVIKLLTAFALTCRLPIPPFWLMISSGSSNGKTELLNLLKKVPGWHSVDDMTTNAMMSGMKRSDKSASMLDRVPKQGFLVFRDFTTMLSKNKEALAEIMGKLRVIYDGEMERSTGGQVEAKKWEGKLSLIAAGTTALYSRTEDFADMGTRALIYSLKPQNDYEVGKWMYNHQKQDKKIIRETLQDMIMDYVAGIKVPETYEELPKIPWEIWHEIEEVSHLASTARSPVERDKFSRDKNQTMKHAKEAMMRLFKQLQALAYGLMLQNESFTLTNADKKLIYKTGLDSVDPRRFKVLEALTKYSFGGDIDQIADAIGYGKSSALIFVEDLFSHEMIIKKRVPYHNGTKIIYQLVEEYRDIMMKFEGIVPEEKELPKTDDDTVPLPVEPVVPPTTPWTEIINE